MRFTNNATLKKSDTKTKYNENYSYLLPLNIYLLIKFKEYLLRYSFFLKGDHFCRL